MIIEVDKTTLPEAARIHSLSWKESHRSFCTPAFVELHSPSRQEEYLGRKLANGNRIFMLVEEEPIGIVSVNDSVIEDLYVLPDKQNSGFGTKLLRYAMTQCTGVPSLWILENNTAAERLYRRIGFRATGRRKTITNGLDEIEYAMI
ncbi:MAG: GNAT family N-acetyltransferase [Faecousia sp.]|nr:GNAT family N-acetyltransferase [Candidatus Coliplasma equi]